MDNSIDTIPAGTLVVVADGQGARLFRNIGDDRNLVLQQQDLLELMNSNDDGPSASPPEATGEQINEATFAKQLALRLNDGALKGRYSHLVLIADPQTLGRMRPLLHLETRQRMLGEIAKTLTNSRLEDIVRELS